MSTPSFLRYPKLTTSIVIDELSHPNTVKFERSMSQLDNLINQVKLRTIAGTLPSYETLHYGYDKVFYVEGMRLSYPVVLCIGYAAGSLWACPDGNVIRETKNPFDEWSIFWTTKTAAQIPFAAYSKIPTPFDATPELRDGLTMPMGPETQALVRYYFVLRARDSALTKYSIEFPEPATLLNVIRVLAPTVTKQVDQHVEEVQEAAKPGRDHSQPPQRFIEEEALTNHPFASRAHSSSSEIDKIHPPDANISHNGSLDPRVHDTPQKDCSSSTKHLSDNVEAYTGGLITKHQQDLTDLLDRMKALRRKIDDRHKEAEYEDHKARKMLQWGEERTKDVAACMDEAKRLRSLAKDDQKEVEAIEQHLHTPLTFPQMANAAPLTHDHPSFAYTVMQKVRCSSMVETD